MATPLGDLDVTIGYVVKRAQSALRARMDAVLRPLELSTPQYSCLEQIDRGSALSSSEIARRAFVTRQSMSTVMHGLRARGLVAQLEPRAGRARAVSLTDDGSRLLATARLRVAEIEDQVESAVDPETARTLLAGLTAIAECLEVGAESGDRSVPGTVSGAAG